MYTYIYTYEFMYIVHMYLKSDARYIVPIPPCIIVCKVYRVATVSRID